MISIAINKAHEFDMLFPRALELGSWYDNLSVKVDIIKSAEKYFSCVLLVCAYLIYNMFFVNIFGCILVLLISVVCKIWNVFPAT